MISYFIRHPTLANLVMLGFLVLGLSSLGGIKRETFPEFALPYISATVVYPGASPVDIEESLCLRMENAVDGLTDIEETRCDAQEGFASMVLKLEEKADVGRLLLDVQTQINAIKDFPTEIEPPVVKELDFVDAVVDIAIAANASWPHLKAYAEDLKHRLKVDADVGLVEVAGFSDHQLRVELDEAAMRRIGVTVGDIADRVGRQNIRMPAGKLELADKTLLVRFDARQSTPDALAQIIIDANADGAVVRLGDIATISDRFELDEEKILFNGKPAAILRVQKNKADDALRVKARVVDFVEQERLRAPAGVTLNLTNDMSSLVADRLSMMLRNGWQGIILVFLSMWLFFSLRYSFWVSAGLPVAFLGGLFLMTVFNVSINIMSLVGLLMAIGIMMDDAIVIAESIAAHIERGLAPAEAVTEGVTTVAPGVLSSFLTTVFIFGSLLGLDGQMGAVLAVVPTVLIMVLVVSLVEAFLILPHHLLHSLSDHGAEKPASRWKQAFNRHFENFRNVRLVAAVSLLVRWRYATVGAVLGLLLASIAMVAGGVIKFVPFPDLDGDIAEARIVLPPGSSLAQTGAVVAKIIASAERVGARMNEENGEPGPLIQDITQQYNFNADAGESGSHIATVRLDLLSAEIRKTLIDDLLDAWRVETGELAEPLSIAFKQPMMGPAGRDIEVRMQHRDLDTLKQASVDAQTYLAQFDGVTGILDDMRPGKEEVLVRLKPGAEAYGADGRLVAAQLRGAFYGQTADEIQLGTENVKIVVQLDKSQAGDLQALGNFPVMLANGQQLPLSSIAELDFERSFVRIQRINGLRTISVIADVDHRRANGREVLSRLQQELVPQLQARYPGLRFDFEGAAKETAKTGASLGKGFLVGLFGVFAILSFQFRSYVEPVVVMLAIPLALIGVFWGHFLLGYSLSMPSIMGFVSLAGIVVNDSILLVQYIRRHIDLGDDVYGAVVSASRERFRAVLLTSLTTAAGLLPILLETSLQAQVVKPLVISIVFGIFASTLLVLLVIPCAYAIMADAGRVQMHESLDGSPS